MEFFVFASPDEDERVEDIYIPLRLSGRLGLYFKVIRPGVVREDFLETCREERIVPQSSRMHEIQYLYDQYHDKSIVRVAGHAADIMKSSFYGHTRQSISTDMLYAFSGYYRKSSYMREQINEWILRSIPYCKSLGIQVTDLFYWEQRIGLWGALYAFEQDLACEEFWPHGCRNLLLSVLRIPPSIRARPKCYFHQEVTRLLWRDLLHEPCNPLSFWGGLRWRVRNNSVVRYYKLKWLT
jgi:hypothetical protein